MDPGAVQSMPLTGVAGADNGSGSALERCATIRSVTSRLTECGRCSLKAGAKWWWSSCSMGSALSSYAMPFQRLPYLAKNDAI